MSEVLIPAAEAVVVSHGSAFSAKAVLQSVGISVVVNAVLPFLLYKTLAPHFPAGSVAPLLYASAFPVLGLSANFIRTRVVDIVALFALFGIAYSVVSTLLAGEVRLAMILGSTQGFLISAIFFASALIERPLIFFIVRQFVAGNDPARRANFTVVTKADGGRTFFIATMVWAFGIAVLGGVGLGLAVTLPPATFLLANNIFNTAINLLLVVWTFRFVRARLTGVSGPPAAT